MARKRLERLERLQGRRKRLYAVMAGVAVVALAGATFGVSLLLRQSASAVVPEDGAYEATATLGADETMSVLTTRSPDVLVEVPSVVGLQISEAEMMLGAVGLAVRRMPTPPGEETSGSVLAQSPPAGERVTGDTPIVLVYADPAACRPDVASLVADAEFVVCIDPGHQLVANAGTEPLGPGSTEMKPKVSGGAVGVVTKQTEYDLALALSLKIKERLESNGVRVVLTRVSNSVNITNAQRALVANESGADLFLRVHADTHTNADIRGVATLYPSGNTWVAPIEAASFKAAQMVHAELLASSGATDRGIVKRSDIVGFNWATVPSILVEAGFMTNPMDDKALADPAYQDKLADGIARGVLAYLEE
jgi:N-acetylmuramoyl-L-alanine amidase